MIKRGIYIVVLIMFALAMSACAPATTRTDKDEDYVYGAGEMINIYDKQSGQMLGNVIITDISIISDEPFKINLSHSEDAPNTVEYEGLIQVCYDYYVADSSVDIDSDNFKIEDYCGENAYINPDVTYQTFDTDDEYFVAAVENLGTYVDITFSFHTYQESIAKARVEYSDSGKAVPVGRHEKNASGDSQDIWDYVPVIAALLLIILGAVFVVKHSRDKARAAFEASRLSYGTSDGSAGYAAVKLFCPYCGCRHAPSAKNCLRCGRELD